MRNDLLATAALPATLDVAPQVSTPETTAMHLAKVVLAIAVLSLATLHPAAAQDILGISSFAAAAVLVVKAFCGLAVVGAAFAIIGGRHQKEALVLLGVGLGGIYKADAIVALFGG